MPALSPRRRAAVLASVCLAVFAINLDTTIVNVALPSLSRQLGAGTSTLQWVVDGYSLAFAALVLTGGSIGDRWGRRPVLILGLLGFAVSSALGGVFHEATALVVIRFVMGTFAALIYPTTLSIITNAYPDRKQRAKAIGVWRGHRSRCRRRTGERRVAAGALLVRIGLLGARPGRDHRRGGNCADGPGVERAFRREVRPRRAARFLCGDRSSRLHDHRSAAVRMGIGAQPRRIRDHGSAECRVRDDRAAL